MLKKTVSNYIYTICQNIWRKKNEIVMQESISMTNAHYQDFFTPNDSCYLKLKKKKRWTRRKP